MGRIVVGTDGSPGGQAAVRWAVHEACLRGAELELVHGWVLPFAGADITGVAMATCAATGEEVLEAAEAAVRAQAPQLAVRATLVASAPSTALVERSDGAELVVVGSRGHGGFTDLLLGSVSSQVVHHAHCPVVVVRSRRSLPAGMVGRADPVAV